MKPTAKPGSRSAEEGEDALRQAKATKSYQDFGLLAEKISEDDFRVNMGDHKVVGRDKLPPQVVKALAAMQPGQVSGLIQIESAYTIIRLNAHTPAHKQSLQEVKADLKVELQKAKYEKLRSGLGEAIAREGEDRSCVVCKELWSWVETGLAPSPLCFRRFVLLNFRSLSNQEHHGGSPSAKRGRCGYPG